MRVLVTGATGLVGGALVRTLRGAHDVYALSRSSSGIPVDLPIGRRISADFSGPWLESLLPREIDAVVHLAQSDGHGDFAGNALTMFRVNTDSTVRLLDYARKAGAKSFLLASSGGLYVPAEGPVPETHPIACEGPLAFYLQTRRASEELAERFSSVFRVLSMRFFFVYGPGQKAAMLFPRLVKSVREGNPLKLDGRDGVRMNPIHVEDAAAAIANLLASDMTGVVNVAGPDVLSLREIGVALGEALGKPPAFEGTGNEPKSRIADTARLRGLYTPTIRVRDRARELVPGPL